MLRFARFTVASMMTLLFLSSAKGQGVESTESLRTVVQWVVALEANDQEGYCAVMSNPRYADYVRRVCQSSVIDKARQAEACSADRLERQTKLEIEKCKSMSSGEFKETVATNLKDLKVLIKQAAAAGVDIEKLLQEERSKRR